MSGETILKLGTPKTLEASGVSIPNNTLADANDALYSVASDGAYYPDAKFVIAARFATAPIEGTTLALYAQPVGIDGTNDGAVPETTRPTVFVGTFTVNNVPYTQYVELIAQDVPWNAAYYIHNNGTGQTLSSEWTLKVTPCTVAPAA